MAQKTDVELLAEKETIKNETSANANTATRVGTMLENIIDSKANNSLLITREFDRAFSSELLFDKNYIEGAIHTQTADITFTVAESGNIAGQESIYGQRIVLDGVNPVYFQGFNHVANIASGDILEAGTYQFIFWYSNGIARASIMLPRQETVLLTPLATPTNFDSVPGAGDSETEIDLTWTAVPNASSLELQYSTTGGGGPWSTAIPLAAGATSYTHTGLTPNTTYHHRLRAIGDLITFSNSAYAVSATTTSDSGDITDPTFTSTPVDTATGIVVNQVVVITANEALIDADGTTEITDANILDYLTAVNSTAGAQSFTATIDASKQVITITPNVVWDENDDITITLSGVEDMNGNEPAAFAITFSTSNYTAMQSNHMDLGSQIDPVITGNDVNFEIEFEFKDIVLGGVRGMTQKHSAVDMQVSHVLNTDEDNIFFKFYIRESSTGFSAREVTWNNALLGITTAKLTLKYFGAIDTNDGLDRAELYLDDVLVSAGKTLSANNGTSSWPWAISNSTSPFQLRGPTFREVRNFKVRNNMGATTIVDIPIIRTGTDVSGNSFDGTWI